MDLHNISEIRFQTFADGSFRELVLQVVKFVYEFELSADQILSINACEQACQDNEEKHCVVVLFYREGKKKGAVPMSEFQLKNYSNLDTNWPVLLEAAAAEKNTKLISLVHTGCQEERNQTLFFCCQPGKSDYRIKHITSPNWQELQTSVKEWL